MNFTDPFLIGVTGETFDEVMDSIPSARLPSDAAAEATARLNEMIENGEKW